MSKQTDFIKFFNDLPDWQERYSYIIELGERLKPLPTHLKVPSARLQNCPSRLYFHVEKTPVINIQAEGNSPLSVGLAGMLAHLFNGMAVDQLMWEPNDFLTETGLLNQLSPQRQTALQEMVRKLRE